MLIVRLQIGERVDRKRVEVKTYVRRTGPSTKEIAVVMYTEKGPAQGINKNALALGAEALKGARGLWDVSG